MMKPISKPNSFNIPVNSPAQKKRKKKLSQHNCVCVCVWKQIQWKGEGVKGNYIKQFEKLISGGGRFKERMSSLLNLLLKLFARGRHCENSKRPFLWLNWDSETLTLLPWQKTQTQKSKFPDHHFILPQTPKKWQGY